MGAATRGHFAVALRADCRARVLRRGARARLVPGRGPGRCR
jgi:hypothetical protein